MYPKQPKLGICALVKELREIDMDGAPLLFHAASSCGENSCFQTAHDLIGMALGKGGVMEQIEAVDVFGRGILMHAARRRHVQIFRDVLKMCKDVTHSMRSHQNSQTTPDKSEDTHALLRDVLLKVDIHGMSCLHHAADAGSCEVLREVLRMCKLVGSTFYQEMDTRDNGGRTPIIFVLRNDGCCGKDEVNAKFNMLVEAMPNGLNTDSGAHNTKRWMEPSSVPSRPPPSKRADQTVDATEAITELMHAARGGLASLELVLNNTLPSSFVDSDGSDGGWRRTVNLDKALAVKIFPSGTSHDTADPLPSSPDTKTWGRALLLAAAAKLGNEDVLYHILDAIQVRAQSVARRRMLALSRQIL